MNPVHETVETAETQYDLVIAYRIYPKVSKIPPVFKDSKYHLAQLCLRSFKASLGTLRVKIFALLDGCPAEYRQLFTELFQPQDLEIIELDGIGNQATFALQVKILVEQNIAQMVYFAEDDYFYLPNEFAAMISFLKEGQTQKVHFVSPYDHLDFYTSPLHQHPVQLEVSSHKHWKTSNSTCMTFLTTKSVLIETQEVLQSYANGNFDVSMWLSLTKYKLFNPLIVVKYYFTDKFLYQVIKKTWRCGWKQILFGKTWKLWSPIPAIATHLDSDYLAPTVDWEKLMSEVAQTHSLSRSQ
jgi:hypothetical protein